MKKSIQSLSLVFTLAAAVSAVPCAAQSPSPTTAPQANAAQAGTKKMSPEEIREFALQLFRNNVGLHYKYRTPEEVAKTKAREKKFNTLNVAGGMAARARDFASAEDYFRAALEVEFDSYTAADLGRMLDYQGKTEEAFDQYKKTFGSPFDSTFSAQGLDKSEAMIRYGSMCEQRGQQAVAVQAYNTARQGIDDYYVQDLDKTLDAQTAASPSRTHAMLDLLYGAVLAESKSLHDWDRNTEALTAFEDAVKRMPDSALALVYLADGLRGVGRYDEATATFKKVKEMDKDGKMQEGKLAKHRISSENLMSNTPRYQPASPPQAAQ